MKYLSCFSLRGVDDAERDRPLLSVGGGGGGGGIRPECVFCAVTPERGFNIVYQDEELIAFRDRWPRAHEHILVIPRRHVANVRTLQRADADLVSRMTACARALYPSSNATFGLHVPPFTSVDHLHLHVLVPPFTLLGRLQYPARGSDSHKPWTWFVTPAQVITILEAGGRVGLGPARPIGK